MTDDEATDLTKQLYDTTDAQFWAKKWCKIARNLREAGEEIIDEGWMIGWFANAMYVAATAERRKIAETIMGYPITIDVSRLWEDQ